MAGAGFKDFAVGEVLTASDVDTYLMQQSVMRFADSAARDSALGTTPGTAVPLAEGMVSYLDDANAVQLYNGTSWINVSNFVQSVHNSNTGSTSTTSSTFQDIVTVSITPTDANNIMVIVVGVMAARTNCAGEDQARFRIAKDGTVIGAEVPGTSSGYAGLAFTQRETAGSTSSRTYQVQGRSLAGGCATQTTMSSILVFEVRP